MALIFRLPRSARDRLALAAVMAGTAITYLRSLCNGFVFDDQDMIVNNQEIGRWSFLWRSLFNNLWWFQNQPSPLLRSYYRPVQDVWLGLLYHLFGLNPAGWHAMMIAIHLIAVWLVFRLAAELTRDDATAVLAALLFALFPLHAEAVVWITAIPLLLAGTLELAAFHFFIRRRSVFDQSAAAAFFAIALFTHESAVVFPMLAAFHVALLEPRAEGARAPGVNFTAGSLWTRIQVQVIVLLLYFAARRFALGFFLNAPQLGGGAFATLMTVPRVLATYLTLLIAPWQAGPSHALPLHFVATPGSPGFLLPAGALIVSAVAFVVAVGRDPRARLHLFCAAWILTSLAPMMNLRAFSQPWLSDRYLFVASFGWCLMLADLAASFARRTGRLAAAIYTGAAALTILHAGVLWHVEGFWHDEETLFTRCIEEFPENPAWHRSLGGLLLNRGDLAGAELEYRKVLAVAPHDGATLYDLGVVNWRKGRSEEAAAEISEGLRLMPEPPPDAYVFLAELYRRTGDQSKSEEAIADAQALPGGDLAVGFWRARALVSGGDAPAAEGVLADLTRRHPGDYRVWVAMGQVLAAQGRLQEALAAYQGAIGLSPPDPAPHVIAADLLHQMGRDGDALAQCRAALELAPRDARTIALMEEIGRSRQSR